MVPGPPRHHAGAMTETPPEPPGSTATRPTSSDEQTRDERTDAGARQGIDTENLRDYRALRRDVHDRKIAGVCGGLARHLDIDPTLVRVVVVVLTIFGGAGLLLYAALWLFVPEQGAESALVPVGESVRNVIVVVALAVALLVAVPSGFDGDAGGFVGLLILGGVVAAVLLSRDSARRGRAPAPAAAQPVGHAGYGEPATAARRPAPRRRGPLLFGVTLASIVLALGVLGLVEGTGTSVPDAAYPALALAVVGAWLVVGSVFGRPGGLALLGAATLVVLSVAGLVEPRFEGERELVVRPTSAAQLDPTYDVPAGRAEIDLRGIRDLEDLDGRTLEVDVNAGEIVLIVPPDLAVDLAAQVSAGGEISTPDLNRGGWGVDVDRTIAADDSRATLEADLQVGFGSIDVRSQ